MGRIFPRTPLWVAPIAVVAALLPCAAQSLAAEDKPQSAAERQIQERAEVQQRLKELDSPCYETRRMAAEGLERLLGIPEMAAMLAEQFEQLIVQPELPFEVRWRISIWRHRLPGGRSEPPQSVSSEELEHLVRQLDDDSYAVRTGANERLRWMAGSEHLAKPILLILKRRLADPSISEESYRRVESIRNIAWGIWLSSDAPDWNLPPVAQAELDEWLDELARPESKRDLHAAIHRRIARLELLDVLSQDSEVPRVKSAIEAHLRGKLDAEGTAALKELLQLTRPALVAESWSDDNKTSEHKQTLEQHLVVGEPTQSLGAAHPSYFDRADDHVAHCVSGNALLPGEYPVGVAFPAPHWQQGYPETVFDLVNLPTPRRQIAYSYYVKTDAAARLQKLSRRTLNRFLSDKKLLMLSDAELGMLAQLDVREVSRFASRYFLMADDGMVEEELNQEMSTSRSHVWSRLGSQSSRFGSICAQLARDGTREAAPGLLEAIRQKKFISPTPLDPYRLEWMAAFSIARRDPWPETDGWLAENIDNKETMIIDHADAAEIGATAAGLLLTRHGEHPEAFGLQATLDSQLGDLKLPGYRYSTPNDADRIRKWWKRQPGAQKTTASTAR